MKTIFGSSGYCFINMLGIEKRYSWNQVIRRSDSKPSSVGLSTGKTLG